MIGYFNSAKRLVLTHGRNDGRIHGTWDFKWPQGSVIKVAFKELDPKTKQLIADLPLPGELDLQDDERRSLERYQGFERLTRLVESLAKRWLVSKPNVEFEFTHPTAEGQRAVERPGAEGVAPKDLYDVLVSLDALSSPIEAALARPLSAAPEPPRRVFLPGSELGRYAQRIDFGVPTVFLGPRKYFEADHPDRIKRYFSSREFYHWVIHEFGHVLGLPHEHQNPNAHERIQLKSVREVVALLRDALGYKGKEDEEEDITDAEVEDEIFKPWPTLKDDDGQILYSDFRSYGEGAVVDDNSSVMLHVFWERLVQGGPDNAPPNYHVRPTIADSRHLLTMYPQADAVGAREAAE